MSFFDDDFLRDFFRMPAKKAKGPPEPAPKQPEAPMQKVSIQYSGSDPIEVRAANIVKYMGFVDHGNSDSIPQITTAQATLRVITMLRKYAEADAKKASANASANPSTDKPKP